MEDQPQVNLPSVLANILQRGLPFISMTAAESFTFHEAVKWLNDESVKRQREIDLDPRSPES